MTGDKVLYDLGHIVYRYKNANVTFYIVILTPSVYIYLHRF